jgi:dUTP pyrophosphatase
MARKPAPAARRKLQSRVAAVGASLRPEKSPLGFSSLATRKGVRIRVVRLAHGRDLPLPAYQTAGAAGLDLLAALPANKPVRLKRFDRVLIPTGLILELPKGAEGQVRPRSGLALKHGVTVLNSPGTIDSDYRGEVQVMLINLGSSTFTIQRGERIAQLVIGAVVRGTLIEVMAARTSARGTGGFGSTGVGLKAPEKSTKSSTTPTKRKSKSKKQD